MGCRDGVEVRALQWSPSSISTRRRMWVEFVVLYSAPRFFSGYSGFPLSSETKI